MILTILSWYLIFCVASIVILFGILVYDRIKYGAWAVKEQDDWKE